MPDAELLLTNALVITVDEKQPSAECVAVKNGLIVYVGDKSERANWQGAGTHVIDCGGQTVVPGFIDAHCHIFSFLRKLMSIDLSGPEIKSIADIQTAIARKVKYSPPGRWINATDYNEFYLAEKRHPTRWELDEVSPDNPVVVSHRSLHGAVLNSRALELAGITASTPEPPGAYIERRTTDGEPDGLLVEMLGYLRDKVIPPVSQPELEWVVKEANKYYLSQGLTSLQDATFVNDYKRWQMYRRFQQEHALDCRINLMTGLERLPEFIKNGIESGSGDNNLRLGAVKIIPSMMTDRQRAANAEYTPDESKVGELVWDSLYPPESELVKIIIKLHNDGYQVAIHAVQEKLVEAIIGVYEKVKTEVSDFASRRHRIEHCAECPPHLLSRIKKLGLVIVTHPAYAYFSGDRYLGTVAPSTIPFLYPLRAFKESGLVVAGASDSPVTPANPVLGIYGGV
ncbi:MAG TPA: amidohydrolase, partial [Dehalococcoidales bacterium]|nr:amidohydrolase [Dehalococcoidales bacterium]